MDLLDINNKLHINIYPHTFKIHLLLTWNTSFSLTFTPEVCKTSFKGQFKKSLGNLIKWQPCNNLNSLSLWPLPTLLEKPWNTVSALRCKCQWSGVTVMKKCVTGLLTCACTADEGLSTQLSSGRDRLVWWLNHKHRFEPQVIYKVP